MHYKTYTPHSALAKYIKCYWSLECYDVPDIAAKDRIFPDGCFELVFHIGDLFRKYNAGDSFEIQPRSFIHGQITAFMDIEATGKVEMFSVRFYPDGLKPFSAISLHEITGENIRIRDFWGQEGDVLEDQILHAATHEQRVVLWEQFLFAKLRQQPEPDRRITHCVHTIMQTEGNITVEQLATELNIGKRQLERQFIANVGVSPKLLSRIIRFQHTLQLIEQKRFNSLTMVAYAGGFYDQAHFIKDFKAFTGLNPKQYFSEELMLAKYLTVET